jgi:5-methylcytosine-specific restriction endonuclease McrA
VAIVFVNIGWAEHYNGTEQVSGSHRFLAGDRGFENTLFLSRSGSYTGMIGRGRCNLDLCDVVYVSREPYGDHKIVGVFFDASVGEGDWPIVNTPNAVLIPIDHRPVVPWPRGQSMRRWAVRQRGDTRQAYPLLRNVFDRLCEPLRLGRENVISNAEEQSSALEGVIRYYFTVHRSRERALREQKIAHAQRNGGKLVCEVAGCGFDFEKVYGEVGRGYAQVHHRRPLSEAALNGYQINIEDLAIVCANCHVMIHRGGECRALDLLISS